MTQVNSLWKNKPCRVAIHTLFFTAILLVYCLPGYGREDVHDVVVKILTVKNPSSYHQPWQPIGRMSFHGTGVIIEGNRILTSAHVVSDFVFIHVRRAGQTKKFPAKVEFFDNESDLALLKVDNQEFFEGVHPLQIGELSDVRDKVAVYGFPDGGEKLSITEGVVSRIEHINYAYSGAYLLACQIDASINDGNSGGPVVQDEEIVGIAFQGMDFNYDNIGYMIPAPVIQQFLDDIQDGRVDGIPDLGITMQKLESTYLRDYFKLSKKEDGGLVNHVLPNSPSTGILRSEDVVLAVNGVNIAYDGTVEFRPGQRTYFGYIVQGKQIGDTVDLRIKRNGKEQTVTVSLSRPVEFSRLVPLNHQKKPLYYIYGGIVFQPLSQNYLYEYGRGNWLQSAPVELLNYSLNREQDVVGREVVILSQVLADEVNIGYHELGDNVVKSVNGTKVENFSQFVDLVERAEGKYVTIIVNLGTKIILERELMQKSTPRILKKYSISSDRNL